MEARNRDGVPPVPLTAADLRVSEDGRRQEVRLLSAERVPLSVCILLDSSGSMAPDAKRQLAIRAVDATLAGLEADDEVAVVLFHEKSELALPWTTVSSGPTLAWDTWAPAGGTIAIDALAHGLSLTEQARHRKRVVLIVSDGMAFTGRLSLERVARTREQSEALVYAYRIEAAMPARRPVGPAPGGGSGAPGALGVPDRDIALATGPEQQLPSLVGTSGGTVFAVATPERAVSAARSFIAELRSQYLVGYQPTRPPDGRYRRIQVETSRRDVRLRHRRGYLAGTR